MIWRLPLSCGKDIGKIEYYAKQSTLLRNISRDDTVVISSYFPTKSMLSEQIQIARHHLQLPPRLQLPLHPTRGHIRDNSYGCHRNSRMAKHKLDKGEMLKWWKDSERVRNQPDGLP